MTLIVKRATFKVIQISQVSVSPLLAKTMYHVNYVSLFLMLWETYPRNLITTSLIFSPSVSFAPCCLSFHFLEYLWIYNNSPFIVPFSFFITFSSSSIYGSSCSSFSQLQVYFMEFWLYFSQLQVYFSQFRFYFHNCNFISFLWLFFCIF